MVTNKTGVFSVVAVGALPLSYQWYFQHDTNSPIVARGTNSTLTVTNLSDGTALGSYFVTVFNLIGETNSDIKTLQTAVAISNLVVVTEPASLVKLGGGADVDFVASVSGTMPIFQWTRNGKALVDTTDTTVTNGVISGSTTAALHLSSITSNNVGTYNVTVSNNVSKPITWTNMILTVVDPGITIQPVSQTVNEATTVTFISGAFSSDTNFHYFWKQIRGSVTNLAPNATNGPVYSIFNVSTNDNGTKYFLVVTNSQGSATSSPGYAHGEPRQLLYKWACILGHHHQWR